MVALSVRVVENMAERASLAQRPETSTSRLQANCANPEAERVQMALSIFQRVRDKQPCEV